MDVDEYDAELRDVDQRSTYDRKTVRAANKEEAIGEARQWAVARCDEIGKKLRLIVTGGSIYGSHSEVIEPVGQ
jgi:hypothetical protein